MRVVSVRGGHTQSNIGTAVLEDAGGGRTLDLLKVLADAGHVGLVAAGLADNALLEARDGALGDVAEGLGADGGSQGEDGDRVLHLGGVVIVVVVVGRGLLFGCMGVLYRFIQRVDW